MNVEGDVTCDFNGDVACDLPLNGSGDGANDLFCEGVGDLLCCPCPVTSTTDPGADGSVEGFGDVVGDVLCFEVGNGLRDLFGLQLCDLFGVLLGDEVRELTSLLPREELDVAIGVFFSSDNGLGSGWQEGGAIAVGEDGFRSALSADGGE